MKYVSAKWVNSTGLYGVISQMPEFLIQTACRLIVSTILMFI
jgi:hypothetical protein